MLKIVLDTLITFCRWALIIFIIDNSTKEIEVRVEGYEKIKGFMNKHPFVSYIYFCMAAIGFWSVILIRSI